jgi:hypothetical protein
MVMVGVAVVVVVVVVVVMLNWVDFIKLRETGVEAVRNLVLTVYGPFERYNLLLVLFAW